jgi:hypothetical protein
MTKSVELGKWFIQMENFSSNQIFVSSQLVANGGITKNMAMEYTPGKTGQNSNRSGKMQN